MRQHTTQHVAQHVQNVGWDIGASLVAEATPAGRVTRMGGRVPWVAGLAVAWCLAAVPAWAHAGSAVGSGAGADAGPAMMFAAAPAGHDPIPDPGLAPDDVVGIMLRALQHNDDPAPDHGIAVTFAFTSPENHDVTGPLDKFRALVKSPAYRLMIGHSRAERGPLTVVADHARERVAITAANGDRAVYVFLLSRQELGDLKGCWMADGVLRESNPMAGGAHRSMATPIVFESE